MPLNDCWAFAAFAVLLAILHVLDASDAVSLWVKPERDGAFGIERERLLGNALHRLLLLEGETLPTATVTYTVAIHQADI